MFPTSSQPSGNSGVPSSNNKPGNSSDKKQGTKVNHQKKVSTLFDHYDSSSEQQSQGSGIEDFYFQGADMQKGRNEAHKSRITKLNTQEVASNSYSSLAQKKMSEPTEPVGPVTLRVQTTSPMADKTSAGYLIVSDRPSIEEWLLLKTE